MQMFQKLTQFENLGFAVEERFSIKYLPDQKMNKNEALTIRSLSSNRR